ncbi:sulfite exporter TauE/SafE family protein, partial [Oceanospirillum sp. HFRX-1_2]
NFTKLIPYAWLGLLDSTNLMTSLALLIFAPVGVYFGMYLHKRINDFWFYMACYGLLFVTGVKLIAEGIAAR